MGSDRKQKASQEYGSEKNSFEIDKILDHNHVNFKKMWVWSRVWYRVTPIFEMLSIF